MPVRTTLPAARTSAGQARRFLQSWLAAEGFDGASDVATLLVSELVTNAVLHAGTDIQLCVEVSGGMLRVEVRDGADDPPTRRHHDLTAATGRGVLLVEELAADWGTVPTESGKVVWFELPLHDAPR